MLGRALNTFQPPARTDKEKAIAPPAPQSSQANIDELLKPRKASQKSIGGYASVRNRPQKPLHSPNWASSQSTTSTFRQPSASAPTLNDLNSNTMKPAVSSKTNGFAETLQRASSFQENPAIIDLTENTPRGRPILSEKMSQRAPPQFDFDPDDFDDDSDINLDIEFENPTALPQSSRPIALETVTRNIAPAASPLLPRNIAVAASTPKHISSSAVSWSSSPLVHKAPISRSILVAQDEPTNLHPNPPPSSEDIRPPKRRRIPWKIETSDELRDQQMKQDEAGLPNVLNATTPPKACYKCGLTGHMSKDCTKNRPAICENCKRRGHTAARCPRAPGGKLESDATPVQKSSFMFNTTASAVKEREKALREKNKLSRGDTLSGKDLANQEMRTIVKMQSAKKSAPAAMFLSDEQKNVLKLVCEKSQSVFFTGSAGTGKSVLMRSIITDLRKKYRNEPDRVAVTASTGLAACNIGGVTLHSFGGIGLGKEPVTDLCRKIQKNQKAKNRWIRTKVLIIDEISMVDGDLFDKLEEIARRLRKNGRPFGGIQLVITGDFFQLPPVPDYGKQAKFAFDAGTWATSIDHTIGLTEVFRQRDPEFANMLNEMRLGKITDQTIKRFRALDRPLQDAVIDATELFPTRNEVDNANANKMKNLVGQAFTFKAIDSGTTQDPKHRAKLLASCMAPEVIQLKKGAQVMLIKNMDDRLVNGSLGKVIAFMDEKTFNLYDSNDDLSSSDGTVMLAGEDGSAKSNTGLSRFRLGSDSQVASTAKIYPLVRFSLPDETSRDLLCQNEDWKVELPNGEIQAQRNQVPLILAWALSIHKAQGQTLERVTVDLKRIFENGQAYVALSRATTQEGLQVKNFNTKAVMAHPKVAKFYDSLYSVNNALKHPKVQPPRSKPSENPFEDVSPGDAMMNEFGDDEEAMAAYG